jgi:hypothetical protein
MSFYDMNTEISKYQIKKMFIFLPKKLPSLL